MRTLIQCAKELMVKFVPLVLILLPISGVYAGYLESIPSFWRNLYPDGGESLYCGEPFRPHDRRYNIEHVYPMSWVARSLRCGDRENCRRNNDLFNVIESDMHNMYPSRKDLNRSRGSMSYAEIPGEHRVEKSCDMELDKRRYRAEPRPAVRGDIARAMLYMESRYEPLKLYEKQRQLMLRWHRADPPDAHEKQRNRTIQRLQGNRNSWID